MLQNDLIIRQIRAFTAALLKIKNKRNLEPTEVLDDLGELFDELFGLKAKIALGLDPAALVRLLSPAGQFDRNRGEALIGLLRLQVHASEALGHTQACRRHAAQIEALRCAGDFPETVGEAFVPDSRPS